MSQFIFMLTKDDVTVPHALDLLNDALETGVSHIGFKDVGVDAATMHKLVERIHDAGRKAHLEVVSISETEELQSAQTALSLEVDYLIGGTRWKQVKDILAGSSIRYFPYPGEIVGHPAQLRGNVEQILTDIATMGERVDGANLLAYRHATLSGDDVLRTVQHSAGVPIICAGSINSLDRVRAVAGTGVWAFTVGTAALDRLLVPGQPLQVQLRHALHAATGALDTDTP